MRHPEPQMGHLFQVQNVAVINKGYLILNLIKAYLKNGAVISNIS